ncbi:MAG: hypothetical protein K5886_13380, partial [Lachnospiraceae bacterium]|nr:hypothetical protein [Lachnospiraceae bacterium]
MKRIAAVLLTGIIAVSATACGTKQIESPGPEKSGAAGLPGYTVNGETDLPGNFFLSFVYTRNLIMLDGKGRVVWSKHEEQPSEGMRTGLWDFKKHKAGNKTY